MDDVKDAMSGLLAPTLRETMLGNAQILEIFNVSKVGKIAGCRVTDGTIERGANVRLIRETASWFTRASSPSSSASRTTPRKWSLGARSAACPSRSHQDMRAGDVIECFRVEEIKRSLDRLACSRKPRDGRAFARP